MTHTESALAEWRGRNAVDSDGGKIGSIDEIYMDAQTGKPEWLAVKTGMFGSKVSFVPIAEASESNGDVRLPYGKDQVKDAPNAEADGELSQDEEAALYSHYGLDYSEAHSRHQRADHRRRDDPLGGGAARGYDQPRERPGAPAQVRDHRAGRADGAGQA